LFEQLEQPELLAEYPGNPPAAEHRRRLWSSETVKPFRPAQGDGLRQFRNFVTDVEKLDPTP